MHRACDDAGWAKIQHSGNIGENMEKVQVEKFTPGVRGTHWLHSALIIGFIITGYGIYTGNYIFGEYAQNLSLHMIMAFVILMDSLAHIYFMTVTGERCTIWISWDDIRDIIKITKNFIGISKEYPEYGTYDVKAKKFHGKYHPVIKLKYWGDMWFLGFAAISGFSMYYSSVFDFINSFLSPVGLGINLIWLKWIHIMVFLYFFCVLVFHVYLALIPVNRELLRSMIYGKEDVEVHK
jgi:cytochrome b subunit of formate dehydrogenase